MGGKEAPQDLLIPKDRMKELAANPSNFILAAPLKPDYDFSSEELIKMEGLIKGPPGKPLNRTILSSLVIWTTLGKGTAAWSGGRPIEGITSNSSPYIMGGMGTFWPLPLQREGIYSTMVWRVTLPEDPTSEWLDLLGEAITEVWRNLFWTLSKRYDL